MEYNLRVMTVGRVAPEDLKRLDRYVQDSLWKGRVTEPDDEAEF